MELAKRLPIIPKRAERILDNYAMNSVRIKAMIANSFLLPEVKSRYTKSLEDKPRRIV